MIIWNLFIICKEPFCHFKQKKISSVHQYPVMQRQKAVTTYFSSKKLSDFGFQEHYRSRIRVLYKLRYIVGFWLVEMPILTNQRPTIYRNLYEIKVPAP